MKFKLKKKYVIIGIIAVVAIAAFLKMKSGAAQPVGAMVTTSPVEKKDIEESLTLKAPLEGKESVEVVSNLHYEVLSINVKEGDKVTKGQVLATLDSKKLEDEIADAKDSLALSRAQLNEKLKDANEALSLANTKLSDKLEEDQKDYDKAVKNLEDAKRVYENIKTLYESGAESLDNLKNQELKVVEAQRIVDGFTVENGKVVPSDADLKEIETAQNGVNVINGKAAALESDRKNIEIAERNLQKKLDDLEDCQIKSTIDGTVTRVNIKVGRFADETDDDKPMFVIENIDTLEMKVMVSEYDIGKIEVGQKAVITADIMGKDSVEGVVARISPTGEEKSGTSERFVPTFINVTGQNDKMISGITAKAKIEIAKASGVMVVPIECVMETPDGVNQVYRVSAEGIVEIIPVELGIENDIEIEVKSEKLAEGDLLILGPTMDMTDGMQVMAPAGAADAGTDGMAAE